MTGMGSKLTLGAGLLALAACGGSGGGAAAVSKWTPTDACKTLDKAAVAAATGQQVKSAELTSSTPDSGNGVAMSMCTYTLANDAIVGVMTRVSKDVGFTDADIEGMRAAIPDSAPLAGLGMKAFWSPAAGSLQLFPDRNSYASLNYRAAMTLPGTPAAPGPDPKTAMVAAAKALL